MSEETKTPQESRDITTILIVAAIIILACIIGFAWNKSNKDEEANANTTTTTIVETAKDAGAMGSNEISITSDNFSEKVEKSDKLVVVDMFMPSCPHCKDYAPNFTAVADEYSGKAVVFGKMDLSVASNNKFANDMGINSVPTTLIYKDGSQVSKMVGSKTPDELKAEIGKYL